MKLTAIYTYITKLFFVSKKSYMLVALSISSLFSLFLEKLQTKLNDDNLTDLSVFFVVLAVAYIMTFVDTFIGILASKRNNQEFSSSKFGNFIAKLVALFIYTVWGGVVLLLLSNSLFLTTIIYGILMLVLINEFVSIGENIKEWFGKKPYLFTLVDKLFNILENKFFNYIKSKFYTDNE